MNRFLVIVLTAFTIFAANGLAQRFAVLSDIHVSPQNRNDSALKAAVAEINAATFDAVIVNGDLTNEGADHELQNVAQTLRRIKAPLHVLPGNHENNWSQSATKTFNRIFGSDRFFASYDSLLIVGINCGPYMKMGDGHIKQEDLHWLRSILSAPENKGKRILSFNHYPVRENDIDNYREYASLLSEFPVIAHINGHYHRWIRYDISNIPAAMTRALDMGKGNFGYAIVDVSKDSVMVYNKRLGTPETLKYAMPIGADCPQRDGFRIAKLWTDSASVFTRLGIDRDNLYFGTSDGRIKAIAKDNPSILKWSVTAPDSASVFSRPTPLLRGRLAAPYSSGLLILGADSGNIIDDFKSEDAPYVADGLLHDGIYLQGGYKRMEARNGVSGELIWRYDSLRNYCQAAPAADGDDIVFGAWDTNLRCLDAKSGMLRWSWNNGRPQNMYSPGNVVPVITEDKVFIVAPDRYMTVLDRKSGRQLWRDNSHRYRESLGRSEDGNRIYAKTMDGELVAVAADGDEFRELWIADMGIGYDHAPCIVAERDGVIYAGSRRGILTAIDAASHKLLWSLPLGVSEINGIDLDPHSAALFVSFIEGTIFRIEKQ